MLTIKQPPHELDRAGVAGLGRLPRRGAARRVPLRVGGRRRPCFRLVRLTQSLQRIQFGPLMGRTLLKHCVVVIRLVRDGALPTARQSQPHRLNDLSQPVGGRFYGLS